MASSIEEALQKAEEVIDLMNAQIDNLKERDFKQYLDNNDRMVQRGEELESFQDILNGSENNHTETEEFRLWETKQRFVEVRDRLLRLTEATLDGLNANLDALRDARRREDDDGTYTRDPGSRGATGRVSSVSRDV